MGGDQIGLERQGAPEMRHRIVKPAAAGEHVGKIAVRFGGRPECDDALVGRDRLAQGASLQQRVAEIGVGIDIVRLQTDRLAIMVHRLVEPSERLEREADVVAAFRVAAVDRDGPADRLDRRLRLAPLQAR